MCATDPRFFIRAVLRLRLGERQDECPSLVYKRNSTNRTVIDGQQGVRCESGGVIAECLYFADAGESPAEIGVEELAFRLRSGEKTGVCMTLEGVTVDGRTPKQFHRLRHGLGHLLNTTIADALKGTGANPVQVWVQICLDEPIELEPGQGKYGRLLESEPVWVGAEPAPDDLSTADAGQPPVKGDMAASCRGDVVDAPTSDQPVNRRRADD